MIWHGTRPFPNLLAFLLAKYRNFPEKKLLAEFEQNIDFLWNFCLTPFKLTFFQLFDHVLLQVLAIWQLRK